MQKNEPRNVPVRIEVVDGSDTIRICFGVEYHVLLAVDQAGLLVRVLQDNINKVMDRAAVQLPVRATPEPVEGNPLTRP